MARLPRTVVPGYPHHVTQRGNRRLPTFFSDEDYAAYLAFMAEQCAACGVAIRAWRLMPNHVHLVAVPETAEALARAVGEARRTPPLPSFRAGGRPGRFCAEPDGAAGVSGRTGRGVLGPGGVFRRGRRPARFIARD